MINLTFNHRQGSEREFADLLNRIRLGQATDGDIKILNTQVRHKDDPEILSCIRICAKVSETVEYNQRKMNELQGKLYTMTATNFNANMKYFKPQLDKAGRIGDTQFLNVLNLKIGARVMLIYNQGKYFIE